MGVLVAARLCGVEQVFKLGGAQAVAAMAYGTESVPKCVKIFGPGNAWVTEAKQQVSRDPDGAAIDMPAGPSEVLVIADQTANPEFIAWDLLSQAEHGPDSQVILLSDSQKLAESVPEHLIINTADAAALAEKVRNAGSVFVGAWTPESLGDYCSGTNHVLPTYGWARAHGALGMGDFMRRMTFQTASREALEHVGPTAETLARFEGLEAHRMAVACRRGSA